MRYFVLLFFCGVLLADQDRSTNQQNAAVLGKLVYTDLSVSFNGESAASVMDYIENELGVLIQVYWESKNKDGCNKNLEIHLKLNEQPGLIVLERVLEQLHETEDVTWQLQDGVLGVGLKTMLSKRGLKKLITYPINDLLFTIRDFEAPELNPSNGPGSMKPNNEPEEPTKQEKINRIIELITTFVEPNLWKQNGGECTISNYQESLLIRAPDFIHRQIGGYPFEPTKPREMRTRRIQYSKEKTLIRVPRK
ncbi:MAG: hypothetical protein QF718_01095 [Phycisphaerales bacterium]|jgi:hypothetical protein|nr:hypothetical protein [Phycisphaerales bacterium]